MTAGLQHVFDDFSELFRERVRSGIFTTEDSVRYLFFHSAINNLGISPNEILLESPHPADPKKEIDMIITGSPSREECVFEFKFHRVSRTRASVMVLPMNAGGMFKDVFRLANYRAVKGHSAGSRCFFVYATDSKMMSYLGNQRNRLEDFFNLKGEMEINGKYLESHPKTLKKHSGKVTDCNVRMCLSKDFDGFAIRIFEVVAATGVTSRAITADERNLKVPRLCGKPSLRIVHKPLRQTNATAVPQPRKSESKVANTVKTEITRFAVYHNIPTSKIKIHRAGCRNVKLHGGVHKYNQGGWKHFDTEEDAMHHAKGLRGKSKRLHEITRCKICYGS